MSAHKGFTLIEIMIVIVIIGITAGFALISFGDFGASRRILFSAEQLVNVLRLAQQQTLLESSTMGLQIDNFGYRLLTFQKSDWAAANTSISKIMYFPANTLISLKTNTGVKPGQPAIIINSSGNMTPFVMHFGTMKEKNLAVLTGYSNGNLKLNLAPTK